MRLFEKYFDGFDFACSGHDIFTCFSWTFSGNELDCLENNKICDWMTSPEKLANKVGKWGFCD